MVSLICVFDRIDFIFLQKVLMLVVSHDIVEETPILPPYRFQIPLNARIHYPLSHQKVYSEYINLALNIF